MQNEHKVIPLVDWTPTEDEVYFAVTPDNKIKVIREVIIASHPQYSTYLIVMNHYINKLPDILKHINYFINFYDVDREYLLGISATKFVLDNRHKTIGIKAFTDLLMSRVVTDGFVDKIRKMVTDLYDLDIDKDRNCEYRSTPKITNDHAKVILACSFALRMILPICLHFVNITEDLSNEPEFSDITVKPTKRRRYIKTFIKIFMTVIHRFERDTCEIYGPICRFVEYRIQRKYNSDSLMWEKKKQVHGTNMEIYLDEVIKEVIIVKSLYKIDYTKSVVSYFDGIIQQNYLQFKSENYKSKPFEISPEDSQRDEDDYISHSESIEMANYNVDESNSILNDVNIEEVMDHVRRAYKSLIDDDEYNFYFNTITLNAVNTQLMVLFYAPYFANSATLQLLNRSDAVMLLYVLKKWLTLKHFPIMAQMCTASIRGHFKNSAIKNTKFIEKYKTSSLYENIEQRFRYVREIKPKDDPIITLMSSIINSSFTWVDYDPTINGLENDNLPIDKVVEEFMLFVSYATSDTRLNYGRYA